MTCSKPATRNHKRSSTTPWERSARSHCCDVDDQWYASGVAADPSDLPADLLDALDNGAAAHQRISRAGKPRVVIGVPLAAVNAEYLEIIPLDALQRTIRTLVISLLIGSIGTTLAGTLVGVYVSRRVLRPVKKMSAVAAGITEGDLRARLDARGDRDLDPLVTSFNEMVDALQDAHRARATLRVRCQPRTAHAADRR